ncbi:MAG: hypothetical protein WBA39_33665 [Rivularia sp. (in: cyanobacteria)]
MPGLFISESMIFLDTRFVSTELFSSMKYRDSSQRVDINCLLDQLINKHPINLAQQNSELDINCLLDELINLEPNNLAEKKSGLDINRLLHTLQEIKRATT